MWVHFDEGKLDFSLVEAVLWIVEWYFGQKQQFEVKKS